MPCLDAAGGMARRLQCRVLRACLQRSRSRCEPPHPQVEHGESAPRLRSLRQGLTGLAQPPRALEPAEGAFDAPAPWPARHPAPLPGAGPEAAGPLEPRRAPRAERARVAPRGPDALPAWTARAPGWHDLVGPCAVLAAGRLDQPAAGGPAAPRRLPGARFGPSGRRSGGGKGWGELAPWAAAPQQGAKGLAHLAPVGRARAPPAVSGGPERRAACPGWSGESRRGALRPPGPALAGSHRALLPT